ncbi:LysR substrate-binding domain-containing protein [Burkholderia lata]|uniref:LysR substrate-binding domain-containing protein n=1 Tax=Burkholderia TaxID=32008 RepID=UPI00145339FD|nr:LysR substrate-binding domain-containing protein [Burkholderia lata]MBN3798876.1 LysR family transcriptional regulator [Burkholderia sp. Ac-20392]VWB74460.1 LysR family transcriptional regulator [Burkholderia lata]
MKHHQLRALAAIAEHGSLRAAARAIHLSQPALTKAIRELELDLGVPLVTRNARGAQLTRFGQAVYARARLILAEMQHARDDVIQLSGGKEGALACALTPLMSLGFLPAALDAFRQRMPTIRLDVREGFLDTALPRLRDGSLDFVIAIVDATRLSPEFTFRPLLESELILMTRASNPLRHCTSLAQLQDAQWILNTSPESIGRLLQDVFVAHGYPAPQPIVECTSFSAAFSLSVHTDTVSCVPQSFMEVDWIRERMVAIDIEETIPAVSVGVLTRRDALNTLACDYLIHCFVEAVRRHDRAKLLWR